MNNNIPHSSAPDGSLYAEVQKTPSPIRQDNPFFPYHPSAPTSPTSNQLKPIMPGSVDYEMGPRSPMQTTQMAVLRAKMNAQKDPGYQTSKQRTPSPRTPTSDPPSPLQPQSPSLTQPINQSPLQRPTELMNGPKSTPETPSTAQQKRMMNYKERRDLDDLLRGIGDNAPVNPSSDSQRPRDEVNNPFNITPQVILVKRYNPLSTKTVIYACILIDILFEFRRCVPFSLYSNLFFKTEFELSQAVIVL